MKHLVKLHQNCLGEKKKHSIEVTEPHITPATAPCPTANAYVKYS